MQQRHRAASLELGGFRVGFDWSILIVLALIAWSLASSFLPVAWPGYSDGAYWLAGLAAAGAFLGSLVAHELSHAIMARRAAGVEVEDITFWLFGGVARIRGDLPTPRLQLLVAGVGPLTSLALGLLLWGLALPLEALGAGGLAAGTVRWLALMNGALAAFNLIPGAPLDGGRVLHAILWRRHGDRTRAAATAARVGQGLGAILVGFGVLSFLFAGNLGGLWTALIGWFVFGAARGEAQVAVLRASLGERRVRDVMSPEPVVGPAWFTVEAFLERFAAYHRHLAFPVREFDGRVAGLVSLDLLRRVPPQQRPLLRVSELARPLSAVVTVRPDDSAVEVATRLATARQGLALVLDDHSQLVGVVSPTDLARAIALGHGRPQDGRRGGWGWPPGPGQQPAPGPGEPASPPAPPGWAPPPPRGPEA
ncbi:MAG TPA: site-2 protease family protein [Actinomycetes bacterium]|nr:site-2 protease family protein [Actinomycetes bacterium]